jgi:hypothetical protein
MTDYIRVALPALAICSMLGTALAGEASFTDILARARAQAAAGHRWEPAGDNAADTLASLVDLLPTATGQQRADVLALVDELISEKDDQNTAHILANPSQDNNANLSTGPLPSNEPVQAARRIPKDQDHQAFAVPGVVPPPLDQDMSTPVMRQQLRPSKPRSPRTVSAAAEHFSSPGVDQRCRSIILRVQLGDPASDADREYLRRGCRQG